MDDFCLVLDIGSGFCKVGFSGENVPRSVYPTVVGRAKNPGIFVGLSHKPSFVGDEAIAKRGILKLKYPVERGFVTNWNDFEKILHNSFYNELRVTPEEHPVLFTEPTMFREKKEREKLTSISFETFNVPCLYVGQQEVLSLFATGRTTGCVCSSGYGFSSTVPVFSGYVVDHAVNRTEFGGSDVTQTLIDLMGKKSNIWMTTREEREIVEDIKHKLCCVTTESQLNRENGSHKAIYELPDGSKMEIGDERFEAPEILFNNSLNKRSIHSTLHFTILKVEDPEVREELYENIVLSGGNTLFKGFKTRLEKELGAYAKRDINIEDEWYYAHEEHEERKYAPWIGGSVISSLRNFNNHWITKDEYDDVGPTLIHRKCPNFTEFRNSNDEVPLIHDDIYGDVKERRLFLIEDFWSGEQSSKDYFFKVLEFGKELDGFKKRIVLPCVFLM